MTELLEKYEKNFLRNDLFFCLIFSLIIFLLDMFLKWDVFKFVSQSFDTLYPTITSGGLTIFVFILTSISIIIAFLQNKKLEQFASSKQPITILKTFFSTLRWFGGLTAVSFFASLNWNYNITVVFFWLIFIILSVSIMRLTRSIWVITKLANLLFILKEPKS